MIIFYHPKTLKIMGASDNDINAMQFPYVETTETYYVFENLGIEMQDGKATVKVIKE
jgi:hypothetical protein